MTPEPVVVRECVRERAERGFHKHTGIFLASLLSGLFWTGLSALVAAALNRPLSLLMLATIAAACTTFLFAVGRALVVRAHPINGGGAR